MDATMVTPGTPAAFAEAVPRDYFEMLARDGHHNPPAFLHTAANIFRGVEVRGKQVLEIGSGRGLMTVLMGLQGATRVTSLEPEMVGATSGMIALQRQRVDALNLRNVDLVTADFNTWDHRGATFDVILSCASINHLYASTKHALRDPETYEHYQRAARKIHGLLAPGGVFIATDASRYAFFSGLRRFGIRRPWNWKRLGVDWRHHQNPGTWSRIFRDAGFSRVTVNYPVPYRLRALAPVVDTAAANFFLSGSFIMRAYR